MPETSYRISAAAELLGVSDDTVRRWAEAGRLETSRDDAGRQVVTGSSLARLVTEQHAQPPVGPTRQRSARNRLRGLVTKVTKDTVMAQVEMQAGPYRLVSLMSREAADELGLAPGVLAVASIKSTSVVVEIPDA